MESKIARLIKRVQDTKTDEIDCSACLVQISEYVDRELDTGEAAGSMPQIKQHLDQCTVCFEEYQVLRALASMEREGRTPDMDKLAEQVKKHGK